MDVIELAVLLSLEQPKEFVFPDDLPEYPDAVGELSDEYNLPWLYALSKKGTIRTYRIEVKLHKDKAVLTTYKRVTDTGVWQSDSYEYTEGVNIGKANETTFSEQAINEANSMYKRLLDAGYSTTKPKAGEKFNTDANGSMKPMLAISFNEKNSQLVAILANGRIMYCNDKYCKYHDSFNMITGLNVEAYDFSKCICQEIPEH